MTTNNDEVWARYKAYGVAAEAYIAMRRACIERDTAPPHDYGPLEIAAYDKGQEYSKLRKELIAMEVKQSKGRTDARELVDRLIYFRATEALLKVEVTP